jgi:hypothetical protein
VSSFPWLTLTSLAQRVESGYLWIARAIPASILMYHTAGLYRIDPVCIDPLCQLQGLYHVISQLLLVIFMKLPQLRSMFRCLNHLMFRLSTGWWFGTFFIFHILGIIIPSHFHIFQRDWNHQPVKVGSTFDDEIPNHHFL